MGLESGVNFIDDLNIANPVPADGLVQADDHMRNIKRALKQTLPNFNRALVSSQDDLDVLSGMSVAGLDQAELSYLIGVVAGTGAADKVMVLDSLFNISNINDITANEFIGALTGNASTATSATTAGSITGQGALATLSSVGAAQIDADAVGSSEIAANAVTASEIAANAVGASEIAANAVGSSEIASSAVHRTELYTTTASVGSTLNSATTVNITLNAYSFFPMIYVATSNGSSGSLQAHHTDGGSADAPRFKIVLGGDGKGNTTYAVDHRYVRS